MNVARPWSVINSDPETSAHLPEAVWCQERTTATNNGKDDDESSTAFFVTLLQRWDVASEGTCVFYQLWPIIKARDRDDDDASESYPTFCLRLPKELAVVDASPTTTSMPPNSPRMQERRVPLLVRFSENQKLLALQFSPTLVRIGLPEAVVGKDSSTSSDNCQHWTVELGSAAKDPYAPVASSAQTMPNIPTTTTTSESILPGGLFWLDQTYRHARGMDYQEHLAVVVTTKSLLCYTVTLNSHKKKNNKTTLSMKMSHVFGHPHASVAWWNPEALVLVIGSYQDTASVNTAKSIRENSTTRDQRGLVLRTYFFSGNGPFTTRREVLLNPLLLPLRLERPPPVRHQGFCVGTSSDEGSISLEASSAKSKHHKYPFQCVSVVTLYGRAFIVDVSAETFPTNTGEHCLEVNLHELDRDNCNVGIQALQQRVVLPKRIRSSKEDLLFTVLDNLLCVTFRKSMFHVFLDIQDVGSDCACVVETMTTEQEHKYLQASTPALFVSPSYVFLSQQGLILPLALDLERLGVSNHRRCNFSMLLRRSQQSAMCGRRIALSRFSAIGDLPEAAHRLNWMDHVASAYAKCCSSERTKITPLQWDLQSSLRLMFQCALLPAGCEFLPICQTNMPLPPIGPSPHPVLLQGELLSSLFLPKTKAILAKPNKASEDTILAVRQVAMLAISYMGALVRHGSSACPALECFVFAVLWRLGDAQAILALLKSRTFALKVRNHKSCKSSRVNYLGTTWHVSLLMAIVQQVEFGSVNIKMIGSKVKHEIHTKLRKRTFLLSVTMLSSSCDYRYAAEHIALLLSHNRLCDATSVAAAVLDAAQDAQTATAETYATLVYAGRRNSGADFVAVAMECWNCNTGGSLTSLCREVHRLLTFLAKWDPDYLAMRGSVAVGPAALATLSIEDDLNAIRLPRISRRAKLCRRPSWIATSSSKPEMMSQPFQSVTTSAERQLSSLFLSAGDRKLASERAIPTLLPVRQLFGYVKHL